MKKLITPTLFMSLLMSSMSQAILKPAPDSSNAPTNDSFITYQWALMNKGQTVISDLDDTHPITTTGNPRIQIGWKNYDSQMKKEVIVAVLDSGLDSAHPEMKDRFIPGHNFTVVNDPRREKIFDDDAGHGTHIAGIMAAISGNEDGITGLSNKIKILPLKVYDSKEDSSAAARRIPISERVTKAIDMAIERKADIIHLSMGWPRIANTPAVEAAFKKATNAGLLVVAAAGNDHHQAQIYPCAYQDVICVGSVDIDGKLSNFSNFGGHVDIVAPGQEILSLWPTLKTSSHFGPKGYELKSGTSQAAPFVSGALAILKGIYPQESARQLKARILLGAEPLASQTAFGLLNIQKAISADPRSFSAPVLKGIEMVEVNPRTLEFDLPLRIEKGSKRASVQISSEQRSVSLSQPRLVSETATEMKMQVRGRLANLKVDNRLQFTLTVDGRKFDHQVVMAVKLDQMNPVKVSFPRTELIRKNDLRSLPDPRHSSVTRYWTSEALENKLRLYVWTLKNDQAEEKSVVLDQISEMQAGFSIVAEDWNMDGQTDYLAAGLSRDEKGEPKEIVFFYMDANLNVIHRLPLKYEGVLPAFQAVKELMVARINAPQIGAIKVPVFWDTGLIPEKDLNPNAFAFEQNVNGRRLYYLEPTLENGQLMMATRTLTASLLDKEIRTRLNLDATQDLAGIGTKVQTLEDLRKGQIELILSVGRGVNVNLYKLQFADLTVPFQTVMLRPLQKLSFDLSRNQNKEALNLASPQLDSETDFHAIFSPTAARSVLMRGDQFGGNKLTLPARGEQIIGVLKSFTNGSNMTTFFETTEWLRAQGKWNNVAIDTKAPVYRSSFLPGALFTQLFVPVVVTADRNPGVMFDNSQLFSSSAVVYSIESNGQLSSTVGRTLSIPTNCIGRSPVLNAKGFTRLSFLCDQGQGFELKLFDLQ